VNVNLELEFQIDYVDGVTCFQYVTVKGIKYFMAGDSRGQIV
jgi:hypothetical protein